MSGLSVDAADYFYYLAIAFTVDTTLAAFFRMCVFFSPGVIVAEVRPTVRAVQHLLVMGMARFFNAFHGIYKCCSLGLWTYLCRSWRQCWA